MRSMRILRLGLTDGQTDGADFIGHRCAGPKKEIFWSQAHLMRLRYLYLLVLHNQQRIPSEGGRTEFFFNRRIMYYFLEDFKISQMRGVLKNLKTRMAQIYT